MPLSRQSSRIVWPSRPVICRPSTSMVMARADLRALRRLRLEQAARRAESWAAVGAGSRSVMRGRVLGWRGTGSSGGSGGDAQGLAHPGGARAAHDVVVEFLAEVSHPG